ncbi:5'-nucleotidase [Melanotaenia boesemani]|uniref:5'-nucleotidase n=1 Tax=Melanotaenia boesemani TaxID=1250792 RepID=UPI001C05A8CF|nr:5'-nucleotidase [Melanotaenia boesemani]
MDALRPDLSALLRRCLCRLLPVLLGFLVATTAAWDLVLLHTNDVHARVEETSVHCGKCGSGGCFGGVARRATMINRIRSEGTNVLLLDAGDQFQGTVWFNFYKGAEAAHFMNKLHYDAMVFGNHEFDNGVDGLMKPFLEKVAFPILGANVKPDETLASTFGKTYLPYKIFTVDGEKVAVVGYTSRETPALSQPGPHVKFEEEVDALQLQVDKLKTLRINKIIALGHSGFTMDKEVAKKVRGIDVVIGGHTNTFLFTGPPPSIETPAGDYPFMVTSEEGQKVPVVQAYAFGKYLGKLTVTFDDDGNVVSATGNPILLNSSIPQDPDILADVEEWKKSLANYSAQVVGKTLVFLNGKSEDCRIHECNLGNLICDAMIDNSIRFSRDEQWNHVGACIMNGGGIRTSIDEQTRNGSITMEDLISVLPFGGTFDLVQVKGSTLKKAFEHSVKRYGQRSGEFLQVSGFRVEYDLTKPPGHRVKSLSTLCTKCRIPQYEPVQDETIYKVVLPSYLVTGGDGFSMFINETLKHDSGDLDISVVSNYIAQRQRVYPSVEGRIQIYNSACGLKGQATVLLLLGLLWSLFWSM